MRLLSIPIFRKIVYSLFVSGELRPRELKSKMPEEPVSSFWIALKRLEVEGLIKPIVKQRKLSIYSLTELGKEAAKNYIEEDVSKEILKVIIQKDNYEDIIHLLLAFEVKKRTEINIDDKLYQELVKKNYEIFLKKMKNDLEILIKE